MFSDSDDEDITAHRKPRHNAIRDSDSEEEEAAAENSVSMAEALVLSASSGEDMDTGEVNKKRGTQKGKRISRAPIDSEDSDPEREKNGDVEEQRAEVKKKTKSTKERKKREKSQRHREKKEKRSKAVEKLKRKEKFSEMNEVKCSLAFISLVVFFSG